MRSKIATFIAVLSLCGSVFAATDTKTHTKSLDIDKLRGDFRDFRHKVDGFSTSEFKYTYTNAAVAGVFAASDYSWLFRLLGRDRQGGSNLFYVAIENAAITKSGNTVTFSVNPTNIPPNGTYKGQLIGYTTSVTNFSRNMGKGEWNVTDSLYDDSNVGTFPFPSFGVTNLTIIASNAWGTAATAKLHYSTNLNDYTPSATYDFNNQSITNLATNSIFMGPYRISAGGGSLRVNNSNLAFSALVPSTASVLAGDIANSNHVIAATGVLWRTAAHCLMSQRSSSIATPSMLGASRSDRRRRER